MELLRENHRDGQVDELWSKLKPKIPRFFEGIEIKPSLLHGDLWSGNAGSINNKEPGIWSIVPPKIPSIKLLLQ